MENFIKRSYKEREELFRECSAQVGFSSSIVEKDFWVTWVLGKLFESNVLKDKLIFKGGTSLSKVFDLIQRFSEDIDLILNWNVVDGEDPSLDRSNTKQDLFNKEISQKSKEYIESVVLTEVKSLLGNVCGASLKDDDPNIINITYPSLFEEGYLRKEIRLEIGPLASWTPNEEYEVISYAAQTFPEVISNGAIMVKAIKAERTFWEKATILHHEANRPEDSVIPPRYSRHYYDLYKMISDDTLLKSSLDDLALLESVVEFKQKFYRRGWAKYDEAKKGSLKITPPEYRLSSLIDDYEKMKDMLYGDIPDFNEILNVLSEFEKTFNNVGDN